VRVAGRDSSGGRRRSPVESAFDYSTCTPLILIAGLCTPGEIRAAGIDGVSAHLIENKALPAGIAKTAATAVALANEQPLALPAEVGTAALVKRLARKLLDLDHEIKDIDKAITERFRDHLCARIIESLPGFGPGLGAEFLVATGGNLTAFATPGRLAAYAGLVPVPRDSGRITGNLRRPTRYNRRLRRVFYMAALSSIRAEGPSRFGFAPTRRPLPGAPTRRETTPHHRHFDAHAPGVPHWPCSAPREPACALQISN
jgi:hypothetical protein